MSLKYAILNVSYQNSPIQNHVSTNQRRPASRYNEFTKKNNYLNQQKQIKLPCEKYFDEQKQKYSIYQQYKKKQLHKKLRFSIKKSQEENCKNIMVRGYVKQTIKHDLENMNNEFKDFTLNQVLHSKHSHAKDMVGTPRRKLKSSQTYRIRSTMEYMNGSNINAIGILGVKTSFLDKYRLKYENSNSPRGFASDLDKQKRLLRRQLLCSTKRNRTIEPRNVHTSQTTRNYEYNTIDPNKNSSNGNKNKYLSVINDQKIQCRPWSPSGEQQFQKV